MLRRALAAAWRSVRRSAGTALTLEALDELRQADRDALLVAVGLLPAPPTGGAR